MRSKRGANINGSKFCTNRPFFSIEIRKTSTDFRLIYLCTDITESIYIRDKYFMEKQKINLFSFHCLFTFATIRLSFVVAIRTFRWVFWFYWKVCFSLNFEWNVIIRDFLSLALTPSFSYLIRMKDGTHRNKRGFSMWSTGFLLPVKRNRNSILIM